MLLRGPGFVNACNSFNVKMEVNNNATFYHVENMTTKEERQRTRNRLAQQKKLARANGKNTRVHQVEESHLTQPATTHYPSWDGDDMHMINPFEPDPTLVFDFADTDVDASVSSHTPEKPSALTDFRASNTAIISSLIPSSSDADWRASAGIGNVQSIPNTGDLQSSHLSLVNSTARPKHNPHQSSTQSLIEETDNVQYLLSPVSKSPEGCHKQSPRHSHHHLPSSIMQEGRQQSRTEFHHPAPIQDRHTTRHSCRSTSTDPESLESNPRGKQAHDFESLESRLERVLHVVEDNGFDSIDSMTSAYYTHKFSDSSIIGPIQFASRSRRLRSLLCSLQESHMEWSAREMRAYRDEVSHMAEKLYFGELRQLVLSRKSHYPDSRCASVQDKSFQESAELSVDTSRGEIARRIQELLSQPDIARFVQKDAATLQNSVSICCTSSKW
ncbi:hypothetical protein F5B22DRAFT_628039 [Xylaria bambusicola]|uniref:uncharacterized protein n=1 Tax=Xylaria bambusicola TaxID=326684 RepID=UPI00200756CD|nr:uncharacterized protein F5B22DRAFT_628039 [Xylaria bambusicola]KAI0505391.1 hypothetical protein F5B22DRAFT_628039 [Xylaria bambusicola]